MKVKLKCKRGAKGPGDVVELPKDKALDMIRRGSAAEIKDSVDPAVRIAELEALLKEGGDEMFVIRFTKTGIVNGKEYSKNKQLRVSRSIRKRLVEVEQVAVDVELETVAEE